MDDATSLVEAIWEGRAAAYAAARLDDPGASPDEREQARRVAAACRTIGERMREVADDVVHVLGVAGIDAIADGPPWPRQRHHVELRVGDRAAAAAAVRALASSGFEWEPAWSGGAGESFWRTSTSVTVRRRNRNATEVVGIRWLDARPRSRWHRVVRPSPADWATAALPTWAWWAYPAVRVGRLAAERAGVLRRGHELLEPYLSTPEELIGPLLDAAGVTADDVVVDLGCGDGRVVRAAAEQRGARAIGFELSAARAAVAADLATRSVASERLRIVHGDAMAHDLRDATVVFLFLPIGELAAQLPTLLDRIAPDGRVIAHEQSRLPRDLAPPPRSSTPVVAPGSLTVAHVWTADAR